MNPKIFLALTKIVLSKIQSTELKYDRKTVLMTKDPSFDDQRNDFDEYKNQPNIQSFLLKAQNICQDVCEKDIWVFQLCARFYFRGFTIVSPIDLSLWQRRIAIMH